MKICVFMYFTPDYTIGYRTEKINKQYCEKHGYDFKVLHNIHPSTRNLHAAWSKLPHMCDVMDDCDYDYVVWIDGDAFFCNHDKKIEDWITPKDITVGIDPGDYVEGQDFRVNTGFMIVKKTEWFQAYVKLMYSSRIFTQFHRDVRSQWEQGAMRASMVNLRGVTEHYGIVKNTNFNNNTNNVKEYIDGGGFVLHMTNFQGKFTGQDRDAVVDVYESTLRK